MNKIYYAKNKQCLVYIDQKADSHYWDSLWNTDSLRKEILNGKNDLFVSPITRQFLTPSQGCRILEGGCGKGNYVYSLVQRGYDAYGIDYAEQTVKKINVAVPEMKVSLGDVRSLPFEDDFFDGYWSLGVIEHFWEGFDSIAAEMRRVVKKGGYVFLTFPHLSPLRRMMIKRERYPLLDTVEQPEGFYQFALDSRNVQKSFEQFGFSVVKRKSYDGVKGILDETTYPIIHRLLYKFYNTKNPFLRVVKLGFTVILAPLSGHIMLLVLKKQ